MSVLSRDALQDSPLADLHEIASALGIDGYRRLRPFDERELRLIEPLRTLRMIGYSAWLAQRWHDPAFPAAFPWFGEQRYWQDQILYLREQLGQLG